MLTTGRDGDHSAVCCDAQQSRCVDDNGEKQLKLIPCSFVGRLNGCNKKVDANYIPAALFPVKHDAYFGRTAANIAAEAPSIRAASDPTHVLLWAGINDILLEGAAGPTVVDRLIDAARKLLLASTQLHPDDNASEPSSGFPLVVHASRNHHSATSRDPVDVILVGTLLPVNRKMARLPRAKYHYMEQQRQVVNSILLSPEFCRNVTTRNLDAMKSGQSASSAPSEWSPKERRRCVVVHFSLFNATIHTYDGIHPNDVGEQYIAREWHAALYPLLLSLPKSSKSASSPRSRRLEQTSSSSQVREIAKARFRLKPSEVQGEAIESSNGAGTLSVDRSGSYAWIFAVSGVLVVFGVCRARKRCRA
jgi:lysophospholipase L1-like esterase